jgi:putative copper resistance protein D
MVATVVAHGAAELPPLDLHTTFTVWEFTPVVTALVAVAAAAYLVGMWRVRRAHPNRPWPTARAASFLAGLAVIAIAIQSSIGVYDDLLFSMHMWQHLLLIVVAPPLLLWGQPVTLLLHASRNPLHTWVKRAVRSRIVSLATHPLFGITVYTVVVVGTHLTSFMELTLTHPLVHQSEHVLYLVAGYLYFLPLIGHEPIRWKLSYPAQLFFLMLAMPVDTFTGVVLIQTNHPMFPAYAGRRDWGPSLVADLHGGGAVMWIAGDGIMALLIVLLFIQVLRQRVEVDAGRWLEGVRARRFAGLAASVSADALSTDDGRDDAAIDTDERQLDAYNQYLQRLNGRPNSPEGSTS